MAYDSSPDGEGTNAFDHLYPAFLACSAMHKHFQNPTSSIHEGHGTVYRDGVPVDHRETPSPSQMPLLFVAGAAVSR
jgi:hypothetical protein